MFPYVTIIVRYYSLMPTDAPLFFLMFPVVPVPKPVVPSLSVSDRLFQISVVVAGRRLPSQCAMNHGSDSVASAAALQVKILIQASSTSRPPTRSITLDHSPCSLRQTTVTCSLSYFTYI